MTKFSIIVPVFNVEPYLEEALNSVKNQTLDDFEVICINDGSTDNSLAILEKFAAKDNRFKVYSQENQGQGIARNKAIELSVGDYIVFLDPDDYMDLNTLEILYSNFSKTQASVIVFDYETFKDDSSKKAKLKSFKEQASKRLGCNIESNSFFSWKNFSSQNLLTEIPLAVWNKAYSSKFIKENNIVFAPNKHGEDHIFSLAAVLLADKIFYLEKAFYHYRNRLGSAVNRASDDNFCIFDNIKILKEFLQKHDLYKKLEKEFEKYAMHAMTWHYTCIPEASIQRYIDNCSQILSTEKNEKFLYKLTHKDKKFIEKIFFIIITILGFEFVISTQKGEAIERQ